ncbi:MAG: hypothetical protein COA91_08865 [Robiginitomaculum sp.]|nr:MAG: hypothetical protein COA91_08865 [Robiginitomaculum sp.]
MTKNITKLGLMLTISASFSVLLLTACDENSTGHAEVDLQNTMPVVENNDPPAKEIVRLELEDEVGYKKAPGLVDNNLARHDFENFHKSTDGVQIERNIAANAAGEHVVDKIQMDFNRFIGLYRTDPAVVAGSSYFGEAEFWTNTGETANIVIQIRNFCTAENPESSTVVALITDTPQTINLSHTFANSHGCALLRVTNMTEGGATIFGASLSLGTLQQ